LIRSSTGEFLAHFKRGAEHGQSIATGLVHKAAIDPMDVSPEERMITLAIDSRVF
jgi:hypothetical protein